MWCKLCPVDVDCTVRKQEVVMIDPDSVRVLRGGKITALHIIEHMRNGYSVTREATGVTVIPETGATTVKIEYRLMVQNA